MVIYHGDNTQENCCSIIEVSPLLGNMGHGRHKSNRKIPKGIF